jgi:hypothetical protein
MARLVLQTPGVTPRRTTRRHDDTTTRRHDDNDDNDNDNDDNDNDNDNNGDDMATKKTKKTKKATAAKKTATRSAKKGAPAKAQRSAPAKKSASKNDEPQFFRMNVEVGNLDEAAELYSKLFDVVGRRQAGSRVYVPCGPVTLQVVAVPQPHAVPKSLYFTVRDLDAVYARAKALNALSSMSVHGEVGGEISVRPWGERSFYAGDPWGNTLCFVEEGTTYPG